MTIQHYNLGQLFESVFSQHHAEVALRCPETTITYRELWELTESLSARLLADGIQHGEVIAIANEKQPLSYALMLAALRLGIAYVNLDVAAPCSRNAAILRQCEPRLLFYDDPSHEQAMAELASSQRCPANYLDVGSLTPATPAQANEIACRCRAIDGASVAYIMFTSGSTGVPKGVAVTHQNVLHFITWGQDRFGIGPGDTFANLSPMYFDNSVFDFYVGLFSGASLVPISRDLLRDPYSLVGHVDRMGCSIWFSVPSLLIYLVTMKAFGAGLSARLRLVIFGGEGYPKTELVKLYNLVSPNTHLVNVYGPTECTCICSAHFISGSDFSSLDGLPTLGHLNPNFDYRIVDESGLDAGVGELWLIGPNVAAGYFNDLERTNASFGTLTDPRRFMKRMYRTGDIVREDNGKLYFIGRKDNQIKHLGYRIELDEIELALMMIPDVSQSAAVYHRTHTAFGKLIGFVSSNATLDPEAVRLSLADRLPEYMVPSRIIVLKALPKNANGKVDRLALRQLLDH